MKPSSYRVDHSGDQSAVYRLDVVATFLEKEMAEDFATLRNPTGIDPAPYAVDADGHEFCVTRAHQLAIFFDACLADEYVEMKSGREIRQQQIVAGRPDGTAAPQPPRIEEPVDFKQIWAAAESGNTDRV